MEHGRITDTDELREYLQTPDALNQLLVTSCQALDADYNEVAHLDRATTLQVEGYVLQPRKLRAHPVEIVTEDAEEARYILRAVRESQGWINARQGQALAFAEGADLKWNGLGSSLEVS